MRESGRGRAVIAGAAIAAVCVVAGATFLVARMRAHEARERTVESPPHPLPTADAVRELVRAELHEGQSVVFEVCAEPAFDRPGVFAFDVVDATEGVRVIEAPLDAERFAHMRKGRGVACARLASASRLGVGSTYAIVARGVADEGHRYDAVRVVGRIVASDHVESPDLLALGASTLGAFLVLLALALLGRDVRAFAEGDVTCARNPIRAATLAILLVVSAIGLVAFLPIGGAVGGLLRAFVVAVAELVGVGIVARSLAPATRARRLGLGPPDRAFLAYASTPFLGFVLASTGSALSRLIPTTSVPPIATLVSTTSGFLSVSLVAILAPIVEEVFFRGAIYGAIEEGIGAAAAVVASSLIFVVVHVPQAFGAWGSILSIAWLGLVLAIVRRGTGSVVVTAAIHLVHNLLVTVGSITSHV